MVVLLYKFSNNLKFNNLQLNILYSLVKFDNDIL